MKNDVGHLNSASAQGAYMYAPWADALFRWPTSFFIKGPNRLTWQPGAVHCGLARIRNVMSWGMRGMKSLVATEASLRLA
jgi:hypothetical protein